MMYFEGTKKLLKIGTIEKLKRCAIKIYNSLEYCILENNFGTITSTTK